MMKKDYYHLPLRLRIHRCKADDRPADKKQILRCHRAEREENKMDKNTNTKELKLEELEQINGGWWPVIIAVAAAGYCFYEAYNKGKKSGWK